VIAFFRFLGHLCGVFLARHWLLGVANAVLTALLGLGALRLVPGAAEGLRLRLRRFILLAALAKGAFYLILGDGHRMRIPDNVGWGFQVPSPLDLFRLVPAGTFSVWRPTGATEQVGLALVGVALLLLARRGVQFALLLAWLDRLCRLGTGGGAPAEARVRDALRRAVGRVPPGGPLPTVVLAELPVATPILVGLRRPFLVLSPAFAAALSDAELEMALRHELAHLRRRDHWWRWLLLWVGDLSRLIPLAPWLGREAAAAEEACCDRIAVSSAPDAAHLAAALVKCRRHLACPPPVPAPLPDAVLPMFLGGRFRRRDVDAALARRLRYLLACAQAHRAPAAPARGVRTLRHALARGGEWLLTALLALIAYTKFFLIVNFS